MIIGLASKSPRRKTLLQELGFKVCLVDFEYEEELSQSPLLQAEDLAVAMARGKMAAALAALTRVPNPIKGSSEQMPFQVLLSADTIVWKNGHIFGKPVDLEDGRRILKALSGSDHQVSTGYCLHHMGTGREICARVITTRVSFRTMTSMEIDAYLASGEPLDKAGAYGIQGKGGIFVKSISGSSSNVIGLPICELVEDLLQSGIINELPWERESIHPIKEHGLTT